MLLLLIFTQIVAHNSTCDFEGPHGQSVMHAKHFVKFTCLSSITILKFHYSKINKYSKDT